MTNCGSCGEACRDLIEECSETEVGGLRCRPVGILDLSVSRDDGDITCVVRADHRVICRGPNTANAISDTDAEDVTLDWTLVNVPDANTVHASLQVRADGREALAICVVTTMGRVACRGDNSTGLMGDGHDRPTGLGYHTIDLPGSVGPTGIAVSMLSWGGDAYALLESRPDAESVPRFAVHRWGGAGRARAPELVVDEVLTLSIGDMPAAFVRTGTMTRPEEPVYMWGPHRSGLSQVPADTPEWETAQRIPFPAFGTACFRDLCCGGVVTRFTFDIYCWGRGPTSGAEWSRFGSAIPQTSIEVGPETYELRSYGRVSQVRDRILLAPDGEGGIRVCDRYYYRREPGTPDDPAPRYPVMLCGDAGAIDAAPHGEGIISVFPEMTTDTDYPSARVDWQAICLDRAPNDWQCWGAHDGWGHPPIP